MIEELRVRELGVIADLEVRLGPGLTVITGETGAGKTLIVEALELVLGGRADPAVVRAGAEEAVIEARFGLAENEVLLSRVVARAGRSRASIDGHMAPVALLEQTGRELVDLYGQHVHQSLLLPASQRGALDQFARVDLQDVRTLRAEIAELDRRLAGLGGDERARAREIDLLAFELAEIDRAELADVDEEAQLLAEEQVLADAGSLREAATLAYERLEGGGGSGALEVIGSALEALARHRALEESHKRLSSLCVELEDCAHELRLAAEGFEEDPARLALVQERRQLLARLVRKHGENLADVLAARDEHATRLSELQSADEARAVLMEQRAQRERSLQAAEQAVGEVRRRGALELGPAVQEHFASLALGKASFSVSLPESGLADEVEFLLANPGEPAGALAKVASGGELARVMLALRLVLSSAPPTLVFDEVDAGIGGQAALAVGRALACLAREHQVLVVTHLAQVASFADCQLVVEKQEEGGRTIARLRRVVGEERIIELSRMLSGHPESPAARKHAAELLAGAASA